MRDFPALSHCLGSEKTKEFELMEVIVLVLCEMVSVFCKLVYLVVFPFWRRIDNLYDVSLNALFVNLNELVNID